MMTLTKCARLVVTKFSEYVKKHRQPKDGSELQGSA